MDTLGVRESCRGKFRDNKILTVTAMFIQECILFLFKNRELFENERGVHQYETRSVNYNYPVHRLTVTEKNVYYKCLRFYNKLPHNVQIVTESKIFKKKIYSILMKIEPYTVEEFMNVELI